MITELLAPKLADVRKHIMIDGAARENTHLTLSHWPSSPTPPHLRRDLSFEIVMEYLQSVRRRSFFGGRTFYQHDTGYVTIDHLDEDGILSVFAFLNPEIAFRNQALLTHAARLGDFNIASFTPADTLTFALRFLLDPDRSYLSYTENPDLFISKSFTSLCGMITQFLEGQKVFLDEAEAEAKAFRRSHSSFVSGTSAIKEIPELSLAVVTVGMPESMEGSRLKANCDIGIHPAAIHTLTGMARIMVLHPDGLFYYDRYETWVRFMSKKLPRRVNLELMAAKLNSEEQDTVWYGDSPGEPIACFYAADRKSAKLSQKRVTDFICNYLGENSTDY